MTTVDDWFVTRGRPDGPVPRVFCFPYAGGSPRAFLDWQAGLGDDAEIVGVCRPGREHRAAEAPPSIDELIDGATSAITALTARDGRPCYLFGHSLGALVAFEVSRRLSGAATPRYLIASGCSAPSLLPSQRVRRIATLTGAEFAEALAFFGGLAPEVLADPEIRDLLLPGLIAEFRMAVGYVYSPGPQLSVPVTLVVGQGDPHVGLAQVAPWDLELTWPADRHWLDGGHFYFDPDPGPLIGIIRSLILADQDAELI
ncbi:MAG TPA: alpha/beta fold hydrolase [Trebonia sp.]|nr:alpha/beta fold hydrolase [Trebonia sp.]